MFIEERNILLRALEQKNSWSKLGVLLPINSMARGTSYARGAWICTLPEGIIQGHPGPRCATREALGPFSRALFEAVLSLDVNTQKVFLHCMSVKHALRDHFWCISRSCYSLLVMPHRRNQHNFSIQHRLYIRDHRWIFVILLISVDWLKISNSSVAGSKCILNRFGDILWRPKAFFV